MTIRLTGILPNPFGDPCPKALIRFTAIATEGGMLKGIDAVATTDKFGSYDFPLEQGRYLLEIQYSDEYLESGSVLVDDASPETMTLQELIRYTTPYTPPLVDDTPADWVSLFEGVLANPDWQHEHENQVRNEDVLVNTDKVISSKDTAQLAQETHTTTTGNAKAVNQTLAYEGSGKEAAYDKSELEAGDLSASTGSEIYSESTGSEAKHHSTLQGTTATSEHVQQITDTNATSEQKDSSGEHTATHKQEATASQVSITESVTDGSAVVTEKKVIDANALVTALIEQGVTIENVEAFDRLIVDAAGSSRQIQVDEFKVGDTFEVDTQNDVVQVKGQLKISNGDDYRGPVGNSQYYEYAYATQEGKDTNDWYIDNPDDPYDVPEGTVWRKHRMVTIIDGETTTGKWSEPYLLTGKDGAEGDTLYWVYMYSADGVLEDPSAEVPSGWSSELKDGHLYRIERLKNKGVYEGVWSTPAKIAGADGDNGELVFEEYMYSPYGTSTPDNDTQGHWHTNFTSGDFYRSSRLIKYAAGTPIPLPADAEPIEVTAWTTPALITPRKGYEYSDGLSQIVVHMYIRSQSAPALPTATLTYDFNTFTLSGDKAGWVTEIPEGTGNLWLTIATASSNTGSDDIAPNEWTSPQLSATQAYNQASLSLYKRSPVGVVPDAPSTTLTYDFTTGVLTGDLEGWSNGTIPAGTEDLYIASAAVRSQTNTADVEPEYWGVGILTSTAFRQQTVNIYKRGNATPPSADVTYNFTDGSITGLTEGWTLDIPSGSEDVFIGVAVASAAGVTDIINPADWSIGPLGTSGHQAVVLNLYMSSQTKPQEPQVEITYDFTQGKIVSDTGLWSTSVPQNTEGKIYVTTASANASALAQTDVIPVGEWTEPQVILESGINAVPVTLYRKHALDNVPSKHTNDLTYSFDNAGLVTTPNNNWKSTPMSVELGEAVWSMTATAQGLATDSTDVIAPTEFSDPVIYTATGSEVFTVYRYAEAETGPWYDEFTPARVWRIQGTSVNGVINDWSDPVKTTGEDGAVGDTIYFEYNYSEDLSDWHPVLVEGDIWRRERIVNNGVAGEWSSPARLKGNEQYIEYQYSASLDLGEKGWHSNFSSGDYYRRERSIINGVAGPWTQGVQIVPLKDVDYSDGAGGDTIYEVYQYSVDGLTDWEYDFEDHHIYRRTAVVINGALGAWSEPAKLSGIDGAPGDTIYMEYEYSADGINWHSDMEDGDIWRHEREHTVGVTEPTDPWGNRTRIRGVDGAYYEYLYNEDNDNYPTTPSDDLGTWHTNFSEGDYYRIERLVQESSVGDWTTPTKLKPKKGEDYNDGIQGPKGEDGITTYTWLKYADDASGSNMSDNPVGKAYMGLAYNKTTDEESTNPNDYAWSKVEGDQGVAGENGYMWVQYSNHDDGLNGSVPAMSQNPIDESTGRPYMYIGISYNNPDPTEGSDPTAYTWSKYIGDEIYYEYSYSPDKISWDMTIDENDVWRRERRVENGQYGEWSDAIRIVGTEGPQGIQGETGADGESLYTWVRYADDSDGNGISNNPTNKKYIGFAYNKITPVESSNKNDYVWSLVQGADGKDGLNGADGVDGLDGEQGIPGQDGKDGLNSYFHTAYADGPNGEGFSQSPTGKDYIGTYSSQYIEDSTNPAAYTWMLVKGAQGEDGAQGIPGVDGETGKTSYLHIAYAETAQGGYMSQDPEGKDYIGQYVDFTLEDSTDPSDYTWSKIKGEQGNQGVEGPAGADGKPTYTWIKYSPNADGSNLTDTPQDDTKYLGISPNQTDINESSNPADYTWSAYTGSDGQYYEDEFSVTGDPLDEEAWHYPAYTLDKFKRTRLIDSEGEPVVDPTTDANGWVYTQIAPIKDVDYGDGSSGDTIFEVYEYSEDGVTDWHVDFTDADLYRRTATVINGSLGPWSEAGKLSGVDGADGDTIWIKHQYSVDAQDWHDTFTNGDVWRRDAVVTNDVVGDWTDPARIRGEDGIDGANGQDGLDGKDGIQGPKGEDGKDGTNGTDGSDGQTSYFHIAYADDANGNGFSQSPTNKAYIGTYSDFTPTDSSNPSDYTWMLAKGADGEDGSQGIPGENGTNGQTSYLHIAYADDAQGNGLSQDATGKLYIGQYVDFTQADSNDPSKYVWALIKGSDGSDGQDGQDGKDGSYWEYEYSINGVDDWHSNFLSGDHFQRARLITPPSTVGEWQVTQVVPIKDVDYDDGGSGDTIYEVYQYSVNGVDNWEDDFKDEHVFRRTAVVINGSQSDWSAAARIMGNDGANGLQSNVITLYQVKQQRYEWLPAELIQTEETYNIISGSFVDYDTESGINGWMLDVPAVLNEGEALYQVRVAALSEAGQLEVDIPADDWAAPVQITASGVSGSNGKHGSGSYIVNWEDTYNGGNGYASLITAIETPLTEGHVEYWFQEISTRESQAGDMLTIQQPEVDSAIPVQWLRSDSAWEKFTLTVDGSAVVNGTLAAQALKSETAITDILYVASNASRAELTLSGSGGWTDGSGNTITKTEYRQWLGAINPAEAPYSVTKEGKLKAQGAEIEGHITAETMTFVESQNELDDLGMVQLSGGGYKTDPSKGWAIDSEGSAIFMNLYARGTMESSTFRSGTIIGSTIYAVDTEELADPYWGMVNEGMVTYYSHDTNVPVAVNVPVSTLHDANPNDDASELAVLHFVDFELYAAADNDSEFSQERSKYPDLPAGALIGTYNHPKFEFGSTFYGTPLYRMYSKGDGTLRISFVETVSGNVTFQDVTFNPMADKNTTVTVGGVTFDIVINSGYYPQERGSYETGDNTHYYQRKGGYSLAITVTSRAGNFGSTGNDSLNGTFKMGLNIPGPYINDDTGSLYTTVNHSTYKMYARADVANTER